MHTHKIDYTTIDHCELAVTGRSPMAQTAMDEFTIEDDSEVVDYG